MDWHPQCGRLVWVGHVLHCGSGPGLFFVRDAVAVGRTELSSFFWPPGDGGDGPVFRFSLLVREYCFTPPGGRAILSWKTSPALEFRAAGGALQPKSAGRGLSSAQPEETPCDQVWPERFLFPGPKGAGRQGFSHLARDFLCREPAGHGRTGRLPLASGQPGRQPKVYACRQIQKLTNRSDRETC